MGDRLEDGRGDRRWARGARDALPFAVTVAAVAVFSFLSGGYIISRSSPVAIAYLLIAAVWVWFLRRRTRPPLLYLSALAVFGLFVAWAGLSVLWSFGPDLSWIAFNLAAFYLAVVAVLGLVTVRGLQLRVAGYAFLAVAVAVAVYAFLGKALPDVVTHAHQYARLASPIGYWNVLALMMAMGLPIALAAAGDRSTKALWRSVAAGAAVPLCFAFFFAFSRGGWLAAAALLLFYFAFSTTRLASFVSLVAIVAPAALVLWRLRGLETLFEATSDAALRSSQGHTLLLWSLVACGVTIAAQAAVAVAHSAVRWPRGVRLAAGAAVLVVLVGVAVGGTWRYVDARGGGEWARERVQSFVSDGDEASSTNSAGRLVSVNTYRLPLWREALDQSEYARLSGTGAGTFPLTHYRFRTDPDVVKHAHSQWLNVLSELGIVGLALFVAALGLFAAAAIGNPFVDRGDPLRPLLVALQAGVVGFLVHISWDWDWDMAAVGALFFLFAATCSAYLGTRGLAQDGLRDDPAVRLSAAREARRPLSVPLRAAASLALVLLAVSWAFPYLAARAGNAAFTASAEGDAVGALEYARAAARYNPLAADPLITESQILQQLGRNREALSVLRAAAELQPDNYDVHRQQGLLYLKAFDRKEAAGAAFERALSLNPLDAELQLELARARVR